MLDEAHHVALHVRDLAAASAFVERMLQGHAVDVPQPHPGRIETEGVRPIAAAYALGTCLLELCEPLDPAGWHQDVIRRSGRDAAASHLAWRVAGIADRHAEMSASGVRVLESQPAISPHGRYRVVNVVPGEETRGVWYQVAEDVPGDQTTSASGNGFITHLHHAVHRVWGLDYTIDLLRTVFGVKPMYRVDLSATEGARLAVYHFGRTKAYFVEPTVFGSPVAVATSTTGTLGGLGGGAVSEFGWAVADLDACVRLLGAAGVGFLDRQPRLSLAGDHRFVDTDPADCGGVSFRLCEDTA